MYIRPLLFSGLLLTLALSCGAQTRKNPAPKTPDKVAKPAQETPVVPEAKPSPIPPKRNERPGDTAAKSEVKTAAAQPEQKPFRYEFSQPDFVISNVVIEHSEDGKGTITFKKKGDDEKITDPISVSSKALERINAALASLNFLDSAENYQYEKDYSHLGNLKFSLSRNGRSREVTYNWTENKDAKILMNEYRKLQNQYVWMFDISVARENQPLEAPRLFDSLDSLFKRNEISDPSQMEPFLKELSNDERIPLIARNHAAKLVKGLEKERQKPKN